MPELIVSFFRFLLSPKCLETPPGEQDSKLRLPSAAPPARGARPRRALPVNFPQSPLLCAAFPVSITRGKESFVRKPLPALPAMKAVLPAPAFQADSNLAS